MTNMTRLIVGFALSLAFVPTTVTQAQGVFPLEPDVAVATMRPRAAPAGARFVLGTYDIRDPICDAPPHPTCCNNGVGCIPNWFAPIYNNEWPNPTDDPADEWTQTNIGLVFGIALDNDPDPSIYVTSTSVYGVAGTGRITKIHGTTGAISPFATLTNTGPGLGNIAFNHRNLQFYVTNHEDGMIHRLGIAGNPIDTFDPFGPYNGTPGFVPLDERIWGLQVSPVDGQLYFGTWSEDAGRPGSANRVYSVALAGDGAFVGSEVLEVTLPDLPSRGYTQPISDISFSAAGKMLIAERGMYGDMSTAPHQARILQYVKVLGVWVPGASFQVGIFGCPGNSTNSSGGVDHTDCVEADACNPGPLVMVTADVLDCCSAPYNIYGLSIMPDTGGDILNSWAVDMDGDTIDQDKTELGDVEVVRTCVTLQQTGACCFPDGSCVVTTVTDCEAAGGRFQGVGAVCLGDGDGDGIDDACEVKFPTVSAWGLVVITLLLLSGLTIKFGWRRLVQG